MSFDEILAPPDWRCVDFISDLHLQESEPVNFLAWRGYLEQSPADALFILGDLFEVWVGDDVLATPPSPSFEQGCCQALAEYAKSRPVFFMHGNRDFLLGKSFAQASGMRILNDPSLLDFAGQRYLLSHGDALCLADHAYQSFRQTVRSVAWQDQFLATPLQERLQQARMMRQASESRKQEQAAIGEAWVDVDLPAARQWMDTATALHFIHGHTHEGRDHAIQSAQGAGVRHVLPDWDRAGHPARGYVLRLTQREEGVSVQHIPLT